MIEKRPSGTDDIVTVAMVRKFDRISKVFCCVLSMLPIFILLRGELLFGDHLARAPLLRVRMEDDPVMFYGLVAFTIVFVTAFWWLRAFLLRGLQTQVPGR